MNTSLINEDVLKKWGTATTDADLFCDVYNYNLEFIDETTWMIIKK